MRTRKKILFDLIQHPRRVSGIAKELSFYPWDSDVVLCTVGSQDINRALDTFDPKVIEDWANALEGREDLDFSSDDIQQIIHELANPTLFGILSTEKIRTLKEKLS